MKRLFFVLLLLAGCTSVSDMAVTPKAEQVTPALLPAGQASPRFHPSANRVEGRIISTSLENNDQRTITMRQTRGDVGAEAIITLTDTTSVFVEDIGGISTVNIDHMKMGDNLIVYFEGTISTLSPIMAKASEIVIK